MLVFFFIYFSLREMPYLINIHKAVIRLADSGVTWLADSDVGWLAGPASPSEAQTQMPPSLSSLLHPTDLNWLSYSFQRTGQDVCDRGQIWGGHCADLDRWPQQRLSSTLPNNKGTLLQPQVLHRVPAAEREPENFTVTPGGEQLGFCFLPVVEKQPLWLIWLNYTIVYKLLPSL